MEKQEQQSVFANQIGIRRGGASNAHWIDSAEAYYRQQRSHLHEAHWPELVAACLCWGDVLMCVEHMPQDLGCGLAQWGGTPADPVAWQRVLERGVLDPSMTVPVPAERFDPTVRLQRSESGW